MWELRICGKILVIISVFITSLVSTTLCAEDLPEARVTLLQGTVHVLRTGSSSPEVYSSDFSSELPKLFVCDRVFVQEGSCLEVEFRDETVMFCDSGTEFEIEGSTTSVCEDEGGSVIYLTVGRIWVYVCRFVNRVNSFSIRTPSAVAGVRGTIFTVFVDWREDTSVSVTEGVVEVEARGVATQITSGHHVYVEKDKKPSSVVEFSEQETKLWREKQSWIEKVREKQNDKSQGLGKGKEKPPGLAKKDGHPGIQNKSNGKGSNSNAYKDPDNAQKRSLGRGSELPPAPPELAKREGLPNVQDTYNKKKLNPDADNESQYSEEGTASADTCLSGGAF